MKSNKKLELKVLAAIKSKHCSNNWIEGFVDKCFGIITFSWLNKWYGYSRDMSALRAIWTTFVVSVVFLVVFYMLKGFSIMKLKEEYALLDLKAFLHIVAIL